MERLLIFGCTGEQVYNSPVPILKLVIYFSVLWMISLTVLDILEYVLENINVEGFRIKSCPPKPPSAAVLRRASPSKCMYEFLSWKVFILKMYATNIFFYRTGLPMLQDSRNSLSLERSHSSLFLDVYSIYWHQGWHVTLKTLSCLNIYCLKLSHQSTVCCLFFFNLNQSQECKTSLEGLNVL